MELGGTFRWFKVEIIEKVVRLKKIKYLSIEMWVKELSYLSIG